MAYPGCLEQRVDDRRSSCNHDGFSEVLRTKRSIIKQMVYRGIRLRRKLQDEGYRVIEVYPYASKVRLWGKPIPKKSTPGGLEFLRQHLSELVPSFAPYIADFGHDLCDAAVAAYTGYLVSLGEAEALGTTDGGLIWVPRELQNTEHRPFPGS